MNNEELLGALARGYCTKRNSQKVLDPDLIQDMAKEVEKLIPLEPIDEKELIEVITKWEQVWLPPMRNIKMGIEELAYAIATKFGVSNKLEPLNLELLEACHSAKRFIENGVELGYIRLPDIDTDPALKTLPMLKQAISNAEVFGSPTKKDI